MSNNYEEDRITAIRKGNDIEIKWAVFTGSMIDEKPYDFDGKKITVYLKSKCHTVKAQDVSVSGNVVTCYFYGKDQTHYGIYSIELVENEGEKGMYSIDEINAFELVKHTCDTKSDNGNGLSFTTIEFRTSKQIDTVLSFEVDNSMHLNLTYISNEKINPQFSLDDEGYLTLS